jgi:hypothetical protein
MLLVRTLAQDVLRHLAEHLVGLILAACMGHRRTARATRVETLGPMS